MFTTCAALIKVRRFHRSARNESLYNRLCECYHRKRKRELTIESWQMRCHSQPDGRQTLCSFDCGSSIYQSFFNFPFSDCLQHTIRCDRTYGQKQHCSWDSVAAIEFSDLSYWPVREGYFGDRWSFHSVLTSLHYTAANPSTRCWVRQSFEWQTSASNSNPVIFCTT